MARKPLAGTVEANWREFGVGALNIDGCRIATDEVLSIGAGGMPRRRDDEERGPGIAAPANELGRWPANLVHDGSNEVLQGFPTTQSGGAPTAGNRNGDVFGEFAQRSLTNHGASEGSAARFFYCAKADQSDRNEGLHGFAAKKQDDSRKEGNPGGDNPRNRGVHQRQNHHPTVKPTDLMRYLCRLVTPAGGLVLDPFMGSGSTGKAAKLEGFKFIGIEREAEYVHIAHQRIDATQVQTPLFAPPASICEQKQLEVPVTAQLFATET